MDTHQALAAMSGDDVLAGVLIVALFLLAPRLRRPPKWLTRVLDPDVRVAPVTPGTPGSRGGELAVFAPVAGFWALLALLFGAMLVWACSAGVIPALASFAVACGASALVMRARRRAGALPARWEEWRAGAGEPGFAGWAAGIAFAVGCWAIFESGAPDAIRAIALGTMAGVCAPWAATGAWLLLEHRRRAVRGALEDGAS